MSRDTRLLFYAILLFVKIWVSMEGAIRNYLDCPHLQQFCYLMAEHSTIASSTCLPLRSVNRRLHFWSFRMTSLSDSSAVWWRHSQTAACAFSLLLLNLHTQWCLLVLSLQKLQVADEEHLTVYRPVSTGTTRSVPAHGNLPFCDSR